jgi:hypothetical protein
MDSSPTTTAASPFSAPSAGVLYRIFALVVVLLPAALAVYLVQQNVVNTPHYDDFTFLEDWLKYKHGTLTWADLFSVHLEHRVTVPRMLAVGLHILGGSDLRWQNGLTLVMLLLTLWNIIVIWRRTTGKTVAGSWFPLLLMSSTLFCAVQWQMLLWPILFEITVPLFCITLMVRLWAGRMKAWTALGWTLLLCGICMLCFANGPVVLCLPIFCLWLQRPEMDPKQRWLLLAVWFFAAIVAVYLYFFTNYHNAVPSQFAYWYNDKMTAADTIKAFIDDPKLSVWGKLEKAFDFIMAGLGTHLSRGLHWNNLYLAQAMGAISVVLFAAAIIWMLKKWTDADLRRKLGPWIVLGLYSGGTATFIMLGRVGRTVSGTMAITPRYMTHAVPLTLALIALVWILGHRLAPRWRLFGAAIGGMFLTLSCVEWIYGAQRMELWQNARLQGRGLIMFSKVFSPYEYLGQVSGDGEYGSEVIKELDKVGQSPVPLLENRLLSQFHVSSKTLFYRQGQFQSLNLTKEGGLEAHGFAELPAQRPADLILFTTKNPAGEEEIFGLTFLVRFPMYWNSATLKDDDWLSMPAMTAEYYARWEGPVYLYQKTLPPAGAPIKTWALDVEKRYVYAIRDVRTSSDPQPPLPPKPKDEKKGEGVKKGTAEETTEQ